MLLSSLEDGTIYANTLNHRQSIRRRRTGLVYCVGLSALCWAGMAPHTTVEALSSLTPSLVGTLRRLLAPFRRYVALKVVDTCCEGSWHQHCQGLKVIVQVVALGANNLHKGAMGITTCRNLHNGANNESVNLHSGTNNLHNVSTTFTVGATTFTMCQQPSHWSQQPSQWCQQPSQCCQQPSTVANNIHNGANNRQNLSQ